MCRKPGLCSWTALSQGQGVFSLTNSATLVQAIAMAGGLKFEAERSQIQILRMTGNGEREVIVADYEAAKTDDKYMLKDSDIVLVPRSGLKTFAKAFFLIFRGGVSFGDNARSDCFRWTTMDGNGAAIACTATTIARNGGAGEAGSHE